MKHKFVLLAAILPAALLALVGCNSRHQAGPSNTFDPSTVTTESPESPTETSTFVPTATPTTATNQYYSSAGNPAITPAPAQKKTTITDTVVIISTCGPDTYVNVDGNCVRRPTSVQQADSTGECNDHTYTSARHEQGACSDHGGLLTWWGPTDSSTTTSATAPMSARSSTATAQSTTATSIATAPASSGPIPTPSSS